MFEKVNTGGVPLSVFELITATWAADGFNLRDDWFGGRGKSGRLQVKLDDAAMDTILKSHLIDPALLRADSFHAVDGGRARAPLASQVSVVTSNIDVVVCTHADADHAEGLIGLLESSLVPVREVRLPGRWSSRLADLCRDQMAFLQELYRDVRDARSSTGTRRRS